MTVQLKPPTFSGGKTPRDVTVQFESQQDIELPPLDEESINDVKVKVSSADGKALPQFIKYDKYIFSVYG